MDGINTALLNALPDARNVLELGCAMGRLGQRYKEAHPKARWHGVDINDAAVAAASQILDTAVKRDLDCDLVETFGQDYDLVVLGDVLEHLKSPERLLADLHVACTPNAVLACCMPNLAHLSVLERILAGDVMYDDVGLLDRTHLRFFTPRSVFKMFLDCGWLPSAAGGYRGAHANTRFMSAIYDAADALGISRGAAEHNLETYQLIILAKRWNQPKDGPAIDLTVVANVTNELQCSLNVARSPGFKEINANVLLFRGAANGSAALAQAATRSQSEWFLVADECAYFPKGSGFALARELASASTERAVALSGISAQGKTAKVGCFAVHRSQLTGTVCTDAAPAIAVPHLLNRQ